MMNLENEFTLMLDEQKMRCYLHELSDVSLCQEYFATVAGYDGRYNINDFHANLVLVFLDCYSFLVMETMADRFCKVNDVIPEEEEDE